MYQQTTITMQPYGYRTMNFQGYKLQSRYPIEKQLIKKHVANVFYLADFNRTGTIDMMEVPRLIYELYRICGIMVIPNQQDIHYLMFKFDKNRDGRLTFKEFKRLVKRLAGHKRRVGGGRGGRRLW